MNLTAVVLLVIGVIVFVTAMLIQRVSRNGVWMFALLYALAIYLILAGLGVLPTPPALQESFPGAAP